MQLTYIQRTVSEQLPSAGAIGYFCVLPSHDAASVKLHALDSELQLNSWNELFFWLPLGPMLSSLGARPFRKAAQCLVCLPFHGAPSVFTTIGRALIVTPSGRNPRAMCHRRSLELTFTSKSHERMVMTLAYLAAANNEEGSFICLLS